MTEREELATYREYWEAYDQRIDRMLRHIVFTVLAVPVLAMLGSIVKPPMWLAIGCLAIAGTIVAVSGRNATRPIPCPRCTKPYFGDDFKRHLTMRRCRYCGLPR